MAVENLLRDLEHLLNHRNQVPEEGFVALMGKILAPLPSVGWEYGPDVLDPAIDRLSLSFRHAPADVAAHPAFAKLPRSGDGWIIDKGIPPRDWEIAFQAVINGKVRDVEGSTWCWSMGNAGSAVELVIGVPRGQFRDASPETLSEMAEVIAMGELGELNLSKFVKSIDVVHMEYLTVHWPTMLSLRKTFVEKFPSSHYADWLVHSR